MGWTFTYDSTKSDIIKELTANEENADRVWTTLAKTVRGNVLWAVREKRDKKTGQASRFILCCLLGTGGRPHDWGYKDMCESMGPFYYNCPLSYLKMVPEVANQEWRDKVLAYHAHRRMKIKVGDRLALRGCTIKYIDVESVKPLYGTSGFRRYRVARRFIDHVMTPAEIEAVC